MSAFSVRPLTSDTWADFSAVVVKHGGVWGGCWCLAFHAEGKEPGAHRQETKRRRVCEGTAHACLVYDGPKCVGWCQFGSPDEVPRIKHLKVYRVGLEALPDWRVTCFFVDKDYRGKGVASVALAGATQQISRLGGGTVESYPEDVTHRTVSASFLYNSRLAMFERQGFERVRQLGKNHWVVAKLVASELE